MAGRRSGSRRGSARRSSNSATVLLEPMQSVCWVKNFLGCAVEGGCSLKLVLACAAGAVTVAGLALDNYADLLRLASLFFSVAVPLFALVCGFSLLALSYRSTWTTTAIYFTLCGAIVAETVAFFVTTAWRYSTGQQDSWGSAHLMDPVHVSIHLAGMLLSTGITCRWAIDGVWIATCLSLLRSVGCLCVPLASLMRLMATYAAALTGVFMAKHVGLTLDPPLMTLMHRSHGTASSSSRHGGADTVASRRRRTSSSALSQSPQSPAKVRRTSLPALLANKNHYPSSNSSSGVDVALLSEAHGLITDLLLESQTMPPHLVSGLKALGTLLSPPLPSGFRPKYMAHAHVALADIQSTSDTEEIPYMGEPLLALSKRGKRFIPPNVLRRMSTSTWTTTTSATGLPTIEPEPCRKRTASFRNTHEILPPSLSPNHSHVSLNSLVSSADPAVIPVYKNRSHSTTSLYSNQHNSRKFTRERKTVCSLYPLHSSDDKQTGYQASLSDADTRGDDSETDPTITGPNSAVSSRRGSALSIRRGSSGGTAGSRRGSGVAGIGERKAGDESRPSVEVVESEVRPVDQSCARCHRARAQSRTSAADNDSVDGMRVRKQGKPRTSDYESSDSPNSSDHCEDPAFHFSVSHVSEDSESEKESVQILDLEELANPRVIRLEDGSSFDLDHLDSDQLLANLKEWDYPIFDLLKQSGELILSSTCYRVFLEVGLFDTFRIPMEEFFHFFHALEKGYRDIPYHNRTHAADVLHAVYYLTSQPIPGFQVLPADAEAQVKGNENASPALTQRASFDFEDSYGIMGANFPALELMALYTAAAMHDYDHPGRTNAFLVSTLAPQAILYNDRSVLENHHAASAWSLFLSDPRLNFLLHLERGEFKRFRYLVIEAILATDLKRHFEILAEFNAKVNDTDAPGIDWTSETDRLLVMQMCVKLADINGPCKSHAIHVEWTDRIVEEFYEQGDEEAALGLPVSPYMDRNNPQLPKLQESFINHLVAPLCNAFGEAGLLPAVWDERSDQDDDDDDEDGTEKSSGCDLTDIDTESMISEVSCSDAETTLRPEKDSLPKRKIICLQTRHLKENHEHWVALIKEEQMHQSGAQAPADGDSRDSVTFLPVEERMEPIAEEHSPRFDRSFSFEPEESKL